MTRKNSSVMDEDSIWKDPSPGACSNNFQQAEGEAGPAHEQPLNKFVDSIYCLR